MNDMNGMLMEVVHLASAALVADLTEAKRKALADIADAIAAIVPVEKAAKVGGEERKALEKIAMRLKLLAKPNMFPEQVKWLDDTRKIAEDALGRAQTPAALRKAEHNYINACDIEAMSLKIPGHKFTAYVEQEIDKEWDGFIMENGKEVVLVHTMGRGKAFTSLVTKYAMRGVASRVGKRSRLRANKRLRLGILTPAQELARTVAEQKEVK